MRVIRRSPGLLIVIIVLLINGCGAAQHPFAHMVKLTPEPGTTPDATASRTSIISTHKESPPARLLIPALNINTLIEKIGVTTNGNLATPSQSPWTDVGWYNAGVYPGEQGSAVIDGHVNRPGNFPAVFWYLSNLQVGNEVEVQEQNGTLLKFHVVRSALYSPRNAPLQDIFERNNGAFLNLITCAGDWIPSEHQTTLRLVVFTARD